MSFDEVLARVVELLRRQGRVSYRALKLRFDLNDDYLEGLKEELIYAQQLASDEDGRVLVWKGQPEHKSAIFLQETPIQRPIAYTPGIWPSASWPSNRRCRPVARRMASARPSPPCSPTSKAPWTCLKTSTPRRPAS
jgi:hypothetical protein